MTITLLSLLINGEIAVWNEWRVKNPEVVLDFSFAYLSLANLRGANLSKIDFTGANFSQASCQKADFSEAILVGVNFSGAELTGVNLRDSDLSRATLIEALLDKTDFSGMNLSSLNFNRASCREANFYKANLSKAFLKEANFSCANLSAAYLIEASLEGANLVEAALSRANLYKANLNYADFENANLVESFLIKTDVQNANFSNADLSRASLGWANLEESDLTEALLNEVNFRGANIRKTKCFRAEFKNSDLREANLSEAYLVESNFEKANMRGASLSGADLTRANLFSANLRKVQADETNFSNAILTGVCIEHWIIDASTNLDDVICDYLYRGMSKRERYPHSGVFLPGEFSKTFQQTLSTIEFFFQNRIDWAAFAQTFIRMEVEGEGLQFEIDSIANKSDGVLLKIRVPPDTNKERFHSDFIQKYEARIQAIEEKHKTEIKGYRESCSLYQNFNVKNDGIINQLMQLLFNFQASQHNQSAIDINFSIINDNKNSASQNLSNTIANEAFMSETRNINTGGGAYYETINTGGGAYIQGNYINMSQDLVHAANQIQDLLNQLQRQGMTEEQAQNHIAREMKTQAQTDPSLKDKMTRWGQSLGDSAVKTVITEGVKTVLRLAGLPL